MRIAGGHLQCVGVRGLQGAPAVACQAAGPGKEPGGPELRQCPHHGCRDPCQRCALTGLARELSAGPSRSPRRPGLLACIQPLHGLTFALFHLAAIRLIVTVAPVRLAATAQAIYGTLSGLSIALVTLASGLLYAHIGGAAFLIMAALCLLALPVCARLEFEWQGGCVRTLLCLIVVVASTLVVGGCDPDAYPAAVPMASLVVARVLDGRGMSPARPVDNDL